MTTKNPTRHAPGFNLLISEFIKIMNGPSTFIDNIIAIRTPCGPSELGHMPLCAMNGEGNEEVDGRSSFFDPGPLTKAGSIAILHLKRDQLVPVVVQSAVGEADGYAEGAVTNTRFGSFPHSTLLNLPWGSQVLASKVDTGSRGRKGAKRKRADEKGDADTPKSDGVSEPAKVAVVAGSGFVHLLPITPESWTSSLPHRTQVVYTPDYSYVLQRLRVRPGQTIIEAGAGSGSFTHAAARAVYSGHSMGNAPLSKKRRIGKVCSFEYHEPRVSGLRREINEHGLDDVVTVTHRDVYEHGFSLDNGEEPSPKANAIFLDLPSPWQALHHLSRRPQTSRSISNVTAPQATSAESHAENGIGQTSALPPNSKPDQPFVSPLDPNTPVHLCTFSPCIEQVQSTVAAMRELGWTEIEMVEVQHRRIDVRRERTGLQEEGLRGVNASAANVDEAVQRLREVEGKFQDWHQQMKVRKGESEEQTTKYDNSQQIGAPSKQERLDRIKREVGNRKTFKEGHLVHRTAPEIKSHTSYLVFAVLPREWSAEDEERCLALYGTGPDIDGDVGLGKSDSASKKTKKSKIEPQTSS